MTSAWFLWATVVLYFGAAIFAAIEGNLWRFVLGVAWGIGNIAVIRMAQ